MLNLTSRTAAAACVMAVFGAQDALADEFYKDKTISIITSTGVGGSYDTAARVIARYMPKYILGRPVMVVRNMPGGGHTRAMNYLFSQAAQDGTVIGTVSNSLPMHQMVDGRGVHFDSGAMNWIGSIGISNLTFVIWRGASVQKFEDALTREVTLGATGTGSGTFIYPNAVNRILGTKFKIISGYKQSIDIDLAMEKGEVSGRAGGSYAALLAERRDWITQNKAIIIAQIGHKRDPLLPAVPLLQEFAKTDEQREILRFISGPVRIGRPYVAPPNVPPARVELLRRAFDATMEDKEFQAETEKLSLDIVPMPGEELTQAVLETVKTSPQIIEKVKAAVAAPGASR